MPKKASKSSKTKGKGSGEGGGEQDDVQASSLGDLQPEVGSDSGHADDEGDDGGDPRDPGDSDDAKYPRDCTAFLGRAELDHGSFWRETVGADNPKSTSIQTLSIGAFDSPSLA